MVSLGNWFLYFFSIFIVQVIIIILTQQAIAKTDLSGHFCYEKDIADMTSTYKENLNHLLSTFNSKSNNIENVNGNATFYNSYYGHDSNKVYLIGLCRGDLQWNTSDACRGCLNDSAYLLTAETCPYYKQAIGWSEFCMRRYSNRSIFGIMEYYPLNRYWSPQAVACYYLSNFRNALITLLWNLKNEAAASVWEYAQGNATGPNHKTLYADVQCTPDLTLEDCTNCLGTAIGDIPTGCGNLTEGGRISRPSCNLRYEIYLFYQPQSNDDAPPPSTSPGPPPTSAPTTQGNKSKTTRTIMYAVVPTVIVLIFSISTYLCVRKAKKKVESVSKHEVVHEIATAESLQYNFNTIRVAADNFSAANKLGEGGFGDVYMGRLSNGQDIAVKRLSRDSAQGELEFKNEVVLVAKLQHRNLVRLLGFCFHGKNGFLFMNPIKRANLDWNMRYKIIEGIARGLLYLHEDSRLKIIHRDLKVSNILLDVGMNPKISDFGMAKLFKVDETQADTSRIVGTYGYMAPEYAITGHVSVKSDVYSFGVSLLEIVSGQKINSFCYGGNAEDLLSFAWTNCSEGTGSKIADGLMRGGSTSEIPRCIHIALLCIQENPSDRPTIVVKSWN